MKKILTLIFTLALVLSFGFGAKVNAGSANHTLFKQTLKLENKAAKLESSGDTAGAQKLFQKADAIQPIKTNIQLYQNLTDRLTKAQTKLDVLDDSGRAPAGKLITKIQTLTEKRTTVVVQGLEKMGAVYDKKIDKATAITNKITETTPTKTVEKLTNKSNFLTGEANWIKSKTEAALR